MKKNILVVCYGGGHAAIMVPVIKEILKQQQYSLTVLALTTAGAVMKAENLEYVSYKDFIYLVDESFYEVGKLLVGTESASSTVPYEESVIYHGINYLDLIEQHGEQQADIMYQHSGRQVFYPINFMTCLLAELRVDLLIATNSPRSEQAAIDAAGLLSINSLCIIDLFAQYAVSWIGKPNYASKLCVLNKSVKELFIKAGRKQNDVIITGNPAFDSLTKDEIISKGLAIKTAREWHSDQVITLLYASQVESEQTPSADPELPRYIENKLRDLVSKDKRYRLVLRFHPSENVKFRPQEGVVFSPPNEKLHPLLHAVDIVIVMTSTVGLEAYLAGKPVISVEMSVSSPVCPYTRMGISSGVSNLEMLEAKISSMRDDILTLSKEKCKLAKLDATSKVMKVINELLDSH